MKKEEKNESRFVVKKGEVKFIDKNDLKFSKKYDEPFKEERKLELNNLVKQNSTQDPFWADMIIKFFDKVDKTESEKIIFYKKLIENNELYNEFTKEILKTTNANETFEKYYKMIF